ncbi:TPA_asm: hypothetical protein [Porphyromonas phage phage006a_EM3]|uniref:DUF4494 domain-containing protein n=1 Tax=Porphyromonas phage phage006a_EM3 TaxID=3154098 RepID=A0AAT9JB93_9CAUD|nr:DUF4494 family protein [Porphyromonas gingivalis]MCE8170495.1 DUF4494 family protein [Porphyromonas gingivalis]
MSLFEVKVSYWGSDEIGATKKFREFYLVDAVSCTDAEARIRAELDGAKDLSVQSVKELKSTFLENDEEEGYIYKAKVSSLSIDEKNGREIEEVSTSYLRAADIQDALEAACEGEYACNVIALERTKYTGIVI